MSAVLNFLAGYSSIPGRVPTIVKNRTNINTSSYVISSLEGVQYFPLLDTLTCINGNLTSLPPIPNKLTYLSCVNNQITSLPTLPNLLLQLICGSNLLSTLPTLPISLIYLFCDNNSLINLPLLPNSLQILNCYTNKLNSLPQLPNSLTALYCENNNITCLPYLPNSIYSYTINRNPFTCLPNYITSMNTATLAYPLCSLNNTNGCPASTDIPTQIIIPNVFTPNNDSVNDTFYVKGANLNNFTCTIYNRWGNELYKWNDITTGWNGKDKSGLIYEDGTYFYVVTYTDNTGKTQTQKGFLQLLK